MDLPTVPCGTCGEPTTFTGTKRCNNCHEVETRLSTYVQSKNGRKALLRALGFSSSGEIFVLESGKHQSDRYWRRRTKAQRFAEVLKEDYPNEPFYVLSFKPARER